MHISQFRGRRAARDTLGVAGTPQSPMTFRRLCVDCEVFYRRELGRVFMTVGDAYSTFRILSQHLSEVSALFLSSGSAMTFFLRT